MSTWVPDAGDVIWMNFDPQIGREQAGHRPAVVLSSRDYNERSRLLICVPTTTKIKGWPFEVLLAGDPPSVALADHLKSFDWHKRGARLKGTISPVELDEIRSVVAALID